MMYAGAPVIQVVELWDDGTPVTSLVNGDLTPGVIQIRRLLPSGTSPSVIEPVGGSQVTVEQVFAGTNIFALRYVAGLFPDPGQYAFRIESTGNWDTLTGVLTLRPWGADELGAWLSRKDTISIASGYDGQGRPTQTVTYGFDSEQDVQTWASAYSQASGNLNAMPSSVRALERFRQVEVFTYDAQGRFRSSTSRVLT